MDIFEFAMEKEKLAESNYRELAGRTQNQGLQNIMTMLADEEVKHYHIIEQAKEGASPETATTTVLSDAKEVFAKMKKGVESFAFDAGELDLYRKAQKIEEKSRTYYLEKAAEVKDEGQRQILNWLAEEEKKHYFLLDNIINFVTEPQRWIDDAEWSRIEQY